MRRQPLWRTRILCSPEPALWDSSFLCQFCPKRLLPIPRQLSGVTLSSSLIRSALLALGLVLAAWSGTAYLVPPAQRPLDAPPGVFSAERAMVHVAVLSAAPRPVGSVGHAAARDYLVAELRRLGLVAEIQDTVSAFRFPGAEGFGAARVQNVIARIAGTESDKAILLNAHYDGANTGPAAGDCGACVAAVLETLRALRAGPPLRHDVIVVFSDAEEMGDHGAHAFATQHPWMQDVALTVNYESMGTAGPGTLYVTSAHNAALAGALNGALLNGFGSSAITELFNAIPDMRSACDLQDYLDAGVAGVGFVLHGQTQNYHTLLDDPAHLDPRSLQSFGNGALGLVLAYDELGPQGIEAAGDAVFFPLAPFGTVVYPAGWSLALAMAAFGIAVLLTGIAVAKRRLQLGPVIGASAGLLATAVLAGAVCIALWAGIRILNPNLQVFLVGGFATAWHVAGLSAAAIAVTVIAVSLLRHWCGSRNLLTGAVMLFAAIGLALAATLPGTSYVATLPALTALPALALVSFGRSGPIRDMSALLSSMAVTALVALLVAPSGMLVAFAVRLEALSGLPLLALPTVLASLAAGFVLAMCGDALPDQNRRTLPRLAGLTLLASFAALGVGMGRSGFDAAHPRPESVRYDLDATTGAARWVTNDPFLGGWSGQFIPARTARLLDGVTAPGGLPTFAVDAPHYDLSGPNITLVAETGTVEGRHLRLLIRSPRAAPFILVQVNADGPITAASIEGQSLDLATFAPAAEGNLSFYASALAADGFTLELALIGDAEVRISLADMSDDLPGPPVARPANTMPTPGATRDGTVVRSTFEF